MLVGETAHYDPLLVNGPGGYGGLENYQRLMAEGAFESNLKPMFRSFVEISSITANVGLFFANTRAVRHQEEVIPGYLDAHTAKVIAAIAIPVLGVFAGVRSRQLRQEYEESRL